MNMTFLALTMNGYLVIAWFVIILLAAFIEASTMDLTSIWFAAGAFAALLLSFFQVNPYVQAVVFVIVSAALLMFLRPIFKRYTKRNEVHTNADRLIGKTAICLSGITPDEKGEVKIDGKIWTAVSNEIIAVGEKVDVLAIEGVKLVVKKNL